MRAVYWLAGIVLVLTAVGCARFPTGTEASGAAPPVTLYSKITVAGQIDPSAFYYLAVNTDQTNTNGPIPIVTGPQNGNGWGTLSGLGPNDPVVQPPFFVQYNGGSFQEYRNGVPIGAPFRYGISDDPPQLWVEVDVRDIKGPGQEVPTYIQLNWITRTQLVTSPQNIGYINAYSALGPAGNDFLTEIPLNSTWTHYSGDASGYPQTFHVPSPANPNILLIAWRVEVRVR